MYTNFTLMWAPLQALVAGFGNSVRRDLFWSVFGAKLKASGKDVHDFLKQIEEMDGETEEDESKKRVDYIKVQTNSFRIITVSISVARHFCYGRYTFSLLTAYYDLLETRVSFILVPKPTVAPDGQVCGGGRVQESRSRYPLP